jgi:hypothetical protein
MDGSTHASRTADDFQVAVEQLRQASQQDLIQQLTDLRRQLAHYGGHRSGCNGHSCQCGWSLQYARLSLASCTR